MRYLAALLVGLFLNSPALHGMPLSPESVRQLRAAGRLHEVASREQASRERGFEVPGRNVLPSMRALRRDDPNEILINLPVILVDFADNQADQNAFNHAYYEEQFFSEGELWSGSAHEWFQENSYGEIVFQGQIVGWLRAPHTYDYYVDGQNGHGQNFPHNVQGLAADLIQVADDDLDFSQFDNDGDGEVETVAFVHAGMGAEEAGGDQDLIWSCASFLNNNAVHADGVNVNGFFIIPEMSTTGTICHECSHAYFGLPDLYDTDYSSNGLGMWSIMAAGCWGGEGGDRPTHYDAWCKVRIGLVEPTVLAFDRNNLEIPPVERESVIYKLWTQGHVGSQYFLVENRQQVGFDESIPASGLLIYHVDEGGGVGWAPNTHEWYPGNQDQGHYGVALEQADGNWDMEQEWGGQGDGGDPYPGSTRNRTFNAGSTPDSRTYDGDLTRVAVENISFNGETAHCNMLVGRAQNDPYIAVSARSLDFGEAPVNEAADQTLTISNIGQVRLNIQAIAFTGNDRDLFNLIDGEEQFALEAGDSSNLVIRFTPASAGHKSATLRITNNDPYQSPLDVRLSGTGITGPTITEPSREGIVLDTTDEGTMYSIHFRAVAPGQQQLTWQISNRANLPQEAEFADNGDGSADLQWQIGYRAAGRYAPRFSVSNDSGETDQIAVVITVNNVNGPPILTQALDDLGVDEDCGLTTLLYLDDLFYDPDGDRITFTASGAPAEIGMTIAGDHTLTIQPLANYNLPRGVLITVQAKDSLDRAAQGSFRLTINPINDPPGAFDLLAPTDSAALADYHTRFSWSAAPDVDADTIRYALKLRLETTPPTLLTQPNIFGTSVQLTVVDSLYLAGIGVRDGILATWWVEAGDGVLSHSSNQQRIIRILPLEVEPDAAILPSELTLTAVYPNPFNETVQIGYALPHAGVVRLAIYDLAGNEIARLASGRQEAGEYRTEWNGKGAASGVYMIRLTASTISTSKLVILSK